MNKFGVELNMEYVRVSREQWTKAWAKFNSDVDFMMTRLLHEAAANYMSVAQVSKASGLTPKKVRSLMRVAGLDPKRGKSLLAKTASEALQENAALLGIEPHEMDLMSPLAYLPMGSEMRARILETKSGPTPVEKGVWRHEDGSMCTSYPDILDFTYTEESFVCGHDFTMVCHKVDAKPEHEPTFREELHTAIYAAIETAPVDHIVTKTAAEELAAHVTDAVLAAGFHK